MKEPKSAKWIIPKEELVRHSSSRFSSFVKDKDFDDLNNLMMNFLHFVCKRRIIKDQDFEVIYNDLALKFPQHKGEVKKIMI